MTFVGLFGKLILAYIMLSNNFTYEYFLAIVGGLRFDLAVTAMIIAPTTLLAWIIIRFSKNNKLNFVYGIIPTIILIIVQVGDGLYSINSQRHINGDAVQFFDKIFDLTKDAFTNYGFSLVLLLILLCFALYIGSRFSFSVNKKFPSLELSFIFLLVIDILMFRSYFTGTPLRPSSVYLMVDSSKSFYAMNGAYTTIYHLFKNNKIPALYKKIDIDEVSYQEYKKIHITESSIDNQKIEPFTSEQLNYNVVIFFLESWPAKYSENFTKENVTPFLNSMAKKGLSVKAMIADGKRTHEGLFAALCSAHNPIDGSIPRTNLDNYLYNCLPSQVPHHSVIFQGTTADLVGDLAGKLGTQDSFGKYEIEDITLPFTIWGVRDYDLFKFVLKKAKQETKPFLYIINNTESHTEDLPPNVEWYFGQKTLEEKEKSILHYVDSQLKVFYDDFQTAVNDRPTLFIFTGDHTRWQKNNDLDEYLVPFIMVATDKSIPIKYIDGYASQIDVAPTIISALGGKIPWYQGEDLLSIDDDKLLSPKYFIKGWSIETVYHNRLVTSDLSNSKDIECYDVKNHLKYKNVECNERDTSVHLNNINSLYLSQELLFKGQTTRYLNNKSEK